MSTPPVLFTAEALFNMYRKRPTVLKATPASSVTVFPKWVIFTCMFCYYSCRISLLTTSIILCFYNGPKRAIIDLIASFQRQFGERVACWVKWEGGPTCHCFLRLVLACACKKVAFKYCGSLKNGAARAWSVAISKTNRRWG